VTSRAQRVGYSHHSPSIAVVYILTNAFFLHHAGLTCIASHPRRIYQVAVDTSLICFLGPSGPVKLAKKEAKPAAAKPVAAKKVAAKPAAKTTKVQ
jgi:hypothetical protein